MRVFLIGGTRFTGPALIEQLVDGGHEVMCVHRGKTSALLPPSVREFIADRNDLASLRPALEEFGPDVAVDMFAFSAADAASGCDLLRGRVGRVVVLSSIDVYLAYGRIHRTEAGPIQATPLTEESELRKTDQPEGPKSDKLSVERIYRNANELPATILRLPAIYGARDHHRRLRCYLKRMDDRRPSILIGESIAGWKFSRGHVENVAHAIKLAIEQDRAANQTFHVAEPSAMTETEFIKTIAKAADWNGQIVAIPDGKLPEHLKFKVDFRQDWDVDSSKIRSLLGYTELIDTPTAVRKTIEWERQNPPKVESTPFDYDAEDLVLKGRAGN